MSNSRAIKDFGIIDDEIDNNSTDAHNFFGVHPDYEHPADESALVGTAKELGTQLGLTARDIAEGNPYTKIGLGVGDIANKGINYVTSGINKSYGTNIPQFGMPSEVYSNALTDVGLPQPRNTLEKIINNAAKSVVSTGGGIAAGNMLANSSSPIVAGVGDTIASSPLAQGISAVTGSGAADLAKESGASPLMQTAAGVLGSLSPSSITASAKYGVNKLLSNPENMERNLASFKGAGTTPTIGQASQTPFAQGVESFLSKFPGGADIMAKKAESQAQEIGDKINELSTSLSPRVTTTSAGRAIEKGIKGEGGFIEKFKDTANELYNQLDNHIPSDTKIPISNTQRVLESLSPKIVGAENTSQLFKNSKIGQINDSLNKDIKNIFSGYGETGGVLPYEAIKKLRTLVGKQLDSSELISEVPKSQWKALYGGLSQDLGQAAQQTSPEAAQAWNRANTYYKAGIDRIDLLNRVVNKDTPEAIYKAATSGTNEGATNLNAVMQSLPEKGKKAVTANLLKLIGKATPGNQNDVGNVFSNNTFLTNWNKLSSEAKQSYLARQSYGNDFSSNMKDIASVADNLRSGSKVFSNPSGTSQGNALISSILSLASSPIRGVGNVLGARSAAKYMTNPQNVNNLLNYNGFQLPNYASPVAINQLLQNRK